jgi:TRAP-type C4-dicarboxylate transport system substrate-binding protein
MKKFTMYAAIFIAITVVFHSTDTLAKTLLKVNHQFRADAANSKLDQWFADEVKSATNGEIEIRFFWSNGLGEPKQNLPMFKNGTIDMASMVAGYYPKELPFFSAPNSLPMAIDNICQASEIMKALMEKIPAYAEEAAQNGIRPLYFHLLNPYLLISKTPITKFSDLKDKRIRIWGDDIPILMKAAGATPVPLFMPDIYEALKGKTLDACPFSLDLIQTYKIYELAKNISEVVVWEGPGVGIWISEKTWKALSPAHQKVMLETAEKLRQKQISMTLETERLAREFLKANGVTFHKFPDEELAAWKKASPDVFQEWINRMEKLGKKDAAEQTVRLWKEIRSATPQCPK